MLLINPTRSYKHLLSLTFAYSLNSIGCKSKVITDANPTVRSFAANITIKCCWATLINNGKSGISKLQTPQAKLYES